MDPKWICYPCNMDGDHAVIYVDINAKEQLQNSEYLYAYRIILTYKDVRENGLPENSEIGPVIDVEEQLQKAASDSNCLYVGRTAVGGHCYFIFYGTENQRFDSKAVCNVMQSSGYELRMQMCGDPDHENYESLYPTDDELQIAKDIQTTGFLKNLNVDTKQEKTIDHSVFFNSLEDANQFSEWATSNDFTIKQMDSEPDEEGLIWVTVSHAGKISEVSSKSTVLQEKASEFKGTYDGWGVSLINMA